MFQRNFEIQLIDGLILLRCLKPQGERQVERMNKIIISMLKV